MTLEKLNLLDWDELQRAQLKHDRRYHPDILALNVIDRLKHMALHQSKYAAKLIEAEDCHDSELLEKTLIDSFIIAVATSNTLGQRLSQHLASHNDSLGNSKGFARSHLSALGRMAKACESIDHLEGMDFRKGISSANLDMIRSGLREAKLRELDLAQGVAARLATVEEKSPYRYIFAE